MPMSTRTYLIFSLSFFLIVSITLGQTKLPSESKISMNVKDASIYNVLKILESKTGLKFVVDPAIQDRRMTVNLQDVYPDEAISVIMESNDLGFRRVEGVDVYIVSDKHRIMRETKIQRFTCHFSDAMQMQKMLANILTPGVGAVIADERTNTLIIRDNPEILELLEVLLEELDQPTPQIYIEAAIAEIALTKNNEMGIEWLWKDPNLVSTSDAVGTRFDLRRTSSASTTGGTGTGGRTQYLDGEGNLWGPGLPIGQGLGIGILNTHLDVVMHAIQTNYDLNILSKPYLVTLDNEEAIIEVGDQIPYKVLNQYGITSYEFKSASVKLSVRPHVNDDNTITINIKPNADFQNGQTTDGIPIIATRKADTRITVQNGKTVVIGGLMRESTTETVSKVPLLGSIPLLGRLFRSNIKASTKTELIVFLTPKIITPDITNTELKPADRLSDDALKKLEKFETLTQ
ncbi:MAG: type II secretion system protein GspD [Fidelibacterota bacterium]